MHNPRRSRISLSRSLDKRGLRVSLETVRTLTSEDLSQVVAGCPTGSSSTQPPINSGSC
jgi:phage head maturation protease